MEYSNSRYSEMYKYLKSGSTLYDLLTEYTQETDFSAASLFNSLRRDINLQQNMVTKKREGFFKGWVNTYNRNIHGRIVDSMLKNMTTEEKEELLKKLQAVNPEKYNFPMLMQYVDFLEDSNFNRRALVVSENEENPVLDSDIDQLNTILIDTAVAKADPNLVLSMRNVLIHSLLIPLARSEILKENPELDRNANPKFQEIEFFRRMFINKDAAREYDSAVEYMKEEEKKAKEEDRIKSECKFKRLVPMSNLTGIPVTDLIESVDSSDKDIINLVSNYPTLPQKDYMPKQNDYYWLLSLAKQPIVVMHEPVEFSKDGIENQELTVVNYGQFSYGRYLGVSKFEEIPMNLIGITALGNDENLTSFFITSGSNLGDINNKRNMEYYKKVLFSPYVLKNMTDREDRLLPNLNIDENGIAILDFEDEEELLNMNNMEAVKYATMFPGVVGTRDVKLVCNLQDFCSSQKLFDCQMKILEELKTKDEKASKKELSDRSEH